MYLSTLSITIASIIFIVYNIIALSLFKVPKSLSMTFYLFKDKYKCGYLFPIMMYLIAGFMMPAWISLSACSPFQFLSFLAPAAILFVGTAPAFLSNSLENVVHQVAAYASAAFSLLWIILVTPYWWIILLCLLVIAALAIVTNTYKNSYIYWLEVAAFTSTFITTILFSII
jgi:hypothetical protein